MGLIATWITGPTNIENVDEHLISPPIRKLLRSLPNNVKEFLNIPLKMSNLNETLIASVKGYELEIRNVFDSDKNSEVQTSAWSEKNISAIV